MAIRAMHGFESTCPLDDFPYWQYGDAYPNRDGEICWAWPWLARVSTAGLGFDSDSQYMCKCSGGIYSYSGSFDVGFYENPLSEVYIGYIIYSTEYTNDRYINVFIDAAGSATAAVQWKSDGKFYFYRGVGTTLLGTSTNSYTITATPHRIVMYYVPNNTTGAFKLWVDDTLEIDVSGVDSTAAAESFGAVRFAYNGNLYRGLHFDDVIIDDSDPPPNRWSIVLMPPISASHSDLSAWPSAGNTYDIGTFVEGMSASVFGDEKNAYEQYDLTVPSVGMSRVLAVKTTALLCRSTGGTCSGAEIGLNVGGSNYLSATSANWFSSDCLRSNCRNHEYIYRVNPKTSAAWTRSDLDEMESVLKIV